MRKLEQIWASPNYIIRDRSWELETIPINPHHHFLRFDQFRSFIVLHLTLSAAFAFANANKFCIVRFFIEIFEISFES